MANPNIPPPSGKDEHDGAPPPPNLETVQADANAALDEVKSVTAEIAAEANAQAQQLGEQVKSQLGDVTARAKDAVSSQKDLLADQVGGVAEAIGSVADELDDKGNATSHYARLLAGSAGKLSETIRNNDIDALIGMANDFGRRQPIALIGMAALLGFATSRFLVASANRTQNVPAAGTVPSGATTPNTTSVADSYQAGGP